MGRVIHIFQSLSTDCLPQEAKHQVKPRYLQPRRPFQTVSAFHPRRQQQVCETSSRVANLRRALAVLLEELVEPLHGLQESSLLGELDVVLAEVCADGEAVLDAGVEDHLVGDGAHFLEQLLGLVALLFGEDLVGFCGSC